MNKRTFFKSLATLAATIALAPELAFGRIRDLPKANKPLNWCGTHYWINKLDGNGFVRADGPFNSFMDAAKAAGKDHPTLFTLGQMADDEAKTLLLSVKAVEKKKVKATGPNGTDA